MGSNPIVGSGNEFNEITMSQENRIKFECTDCKRIGYNSTKNKKKVKDRLELSKFCKFCKKHTKHKETK